MKILVGSKNLVKIQAVMEVFHGEDDFVGGEDVPSGVRAQPLSQAETRLGAIQRAKAVFNQYQPDLAIGLEGGVFFDHDQLYLCNWGALIDPSGQIFEVAGMVLKLPMEIKKPLWSGLELNEVMFKLFGANELRCKEGAIGYFTRGSLNRKEVFSSMVRGLRGQYLYQQHLL
ncbi:MAG: DUF84 family protein [Chlamydiae bacterium]|nr:DUF84 family protein [Chlamydiota bacterium]